MASVIYGRAGHYAVLLVIVAVLFLPHLGTPSLWDIDEGHNAEAAREMLESGNWIVPTFNFQLRVDKPALLYWLQIFAYQLFGVSEFAARLPSALAALLAVLLTYEFGCFLFNAATGLAAGVMLASAVLFSGAAHFANPDALLCAFTLLTLLLFWVGFQRQDTRWLIPAGIAAGLAVLAKGPVGFVLPGAVIGLFLILTRRLGFLWNRRFALGLFAFAAVALPWYIWVSVDTRANFLRGFILTHNVNRFLSPMENHSGPAYYYLVVLLVGFAPWSAFLGLTAWSSWREWRSSGSPCRETHSFLWCWIAVYLVFFTVSSTKLPNYILPIYPAVALLTARCLERWRCGELVLPRWPMQLGLASLAFVGVVATLGLLVAGGGVPLSALKGRALAGLDSWAFLGVFPVLGAAVGWFALRRQRRTAVVVAVAGAAVFFVGGLAIGTATTLDALKAPRPLGQAVLASAAEPEVRVGCFSYYQPSLVYYCRREVKRFESEGQALEFLRWPIPVYLFVPERVWEKLRETTNQTGYVVGRHYDLYRGHEVVVVSNRTAQSP